MFQNGSHKFNYSCRLTCCDKKNLLFQKGPPLNNPFWTEFDFLKKFVGFTIYFVFLARTVYTHYMRVGWSVGPETMQYPPIQLQFDINFRTLVSYKFGGHLISSSVGGFHDSVCNSWNVSMTSLCLDCWEV